MTAELYRVARAVGLAVAAAWIALKIALAVMTYEGMAPDTILFGEQVAFGLFLSLLVLGGALFMIGKSAAFDAQRAKLAAGKNTPKLPETVRSRMTYTSVAVLMAMVFAIRYLAPDDKTRDLILGLLPFVFAPVFLIIYVLLARRYRGKGGPDGNPGST